jgi:anaerobic selenocysteine-containing dehydrogenase
MGTQYKFTVPDEANSSMLVGLGWNGMESHQMPRAPIVLRDFSKDPSKLLVIIDPRKTETAEIADIHLAIRPGTDALLIKAMIAIIIDEGWADDEYLHARVSGFGAIQGWFAGFNARQALKVCTLDYDQVREVCRQMRVRKTSFHPDLGIYMNRHSTLTCYLIIVLAAITGNLCVPGGNVIPGMLMPLVSHSDERDSRTWRTVETDYPALCGLFPPNVMPEEIMSEKTDRLRTLLCCQANPLRSFADTAAYEEAFSRLDLLVVCDVAMTETAALAHYVLPARTGYESWDGTFFPWTWPEIYFQMRRPVVEPEGEPLELAEIHLRIADAMGLVPPIPDSLHEAAQAGRVQFGMALMNYGAENPQAMKAMPFIVMKTLGRELGSCNLASLWALLMTAPGGFKKSAGRAGFAKSPLMGEEIFKAIMDHPQGMWIGKADPDDNFSEIGTDDGKINVHIPEMESWLAEIEPGMEDAALQMDPRFPFILSSGRHMKYNANTIMRDPAWNRGARACTCIINPDDAQDLDIVDGEPVRVTTEAGSVTVEAEVSEGGSRGYGMSPHGVGLS